MPPSQLDPDELLERARAGDARAFEQLVAPHIAPVRRLTRAFCRHPADADDLAQEALLKAYRFIGSFRGGSFASWLHSVARSVCHDWYRAQRARGRGLENELDEAREVAPGVGAQQLLIERDRSEDLWAAIRQLDPKFRVPLVLFEIEGLSYEQVARVEGIALGTLRSRLARAREKLRQLLKAPSGPPGTYDAAAPSSSLRQGN